MCALAEQRRPQIALGPKPHEQQPQRLTLAVRHLPQPIDGPHLDVRKTLLRHDGDMIDATVAVLVRGEKEGVFVPLQWLACRILSYQPRTPPAQLPCPGQSHRATTGAGNDRAARDGIAPRGPGFR